MSQQKAEDRLLKAKEVARILSISERSLWRLLASGEIIEPVRIGRAVRWRSDELWSWIQHGCPPQNGGTGR